MSVSFTIAFDAAGISEDYRYCLIFQQHPQNQPHASPILHEERLSLGERVLFHQVEGKWIDQPAMVKPPPAGQLIMGNLTGFPEVTIAYLVLSKGLGCYAFPDTVLRNLFPSQQSATTALLDDGDNYVQAFVAIVSNLQAWNNRTEMIAALREINPSIKSVEPEMPDQKRLFVSHEVGGRLLVLDLNQESEGFRRFLAHLIFLSSTQRGRRFALFRGLRFRLREYESWLIAGVDSLQGKPLPDGRPGLRPGKTVPAGNLEESPRDAKGWLRQNMVSGYKPTTDQRPLTELVALDSIRSQNLRSFRRLDSAIQHLVNAIRSGNHASPGEHAGFRLLLGFCVFQSGGNVTHDFFSRCTSGQGETC